MKQVLRQPLFWISCCFFLAAAALSVISGVSQPDIPAMSKMEKGINRQDLKTMLRAFAPSVQEELALAASLEIGDLFPEEFRSAEVNVIYGEPVTDESGETTVQAFMILNRDGTCVEADCEEIMLEEVDGKLYLSAF